MLLHTGKELCKLCDLIMATLILPCPPPQPLPPQVLTIGATNLAQDLDQACSSPPSSSLPLQVLTIGATNLAQDLDQALLRPGRFEAVFEIPSPGWRCLVISKCTPAGIIVLLLHRSHS